MYVRICQNTDLFRSLIERAGADPRSSPSAGGCDYAARDLHVHRRVRSVGKARCFADTRADPRAAGHLSLRARIADRIDRSSRNGHIADFRAVSGADPGAILSACSQINSAALYFDKRVLLGDRLRLIAALLGCQRAVSDPGRA